MPTGWKGPSPAMRQARLEQAAYEQQERFTIAAMQAYICRGGESSDDSRKLALKAVSAANATIAYMDANLAPINRS